MAMAAVAATSAYCGAACSAGRGGRSDGRGVLAMAAAGKLGMHACEGLGVGWGLSSQPQRAAAGLVGWDGSEEREGESMIGDYCLLYSPLKEVSTTRSKRRVGVGLVAASGRACGRSWQAKAVPDQVTNGAFSDAGAARLGRVSRVTKETQVEVEINLDGTGICNCDTGIPFLDHMLDQLASHGLFDLNIQAKGDIHIDDHHSNEDIALALGTALLKALGDRKGIQRFGDFSAPLDEALVHVVLDLSGRPYLGYGVEIPTQRVGTYDTQLVEHFFQSVVNTSGMTLHIRQLAGKNSHHIIEATFKAFARALRQATEFDSRRGSSIPSSKGVLSRA